MWTLGLMSGTSMDGIDAALIKTDGEKIFDVGPATTIRYTDGLKKLIRAALGRKKPSPILIQTITDAHFEAVTTLLSENPGFKEKIKLIGMHGHTILHAPNTNTTLQVGDGERLAKNIGVNVVCDFRSADVANGGQGAPLTPLYHSALAEGLEKPLIVVNIGGIANLTWIGRDNHSTPIAFDTGPGNCLLDDWVQGNTTEQFDKNGILSAAGIPNDRLVQIMMEDPYFNSPPPKSLDRLDLNYKCISGLEPADGAATLVLYTCKTIMAAIQYVPEPPKRLLVTGGGRLNSTIMHELSCLTSIPVEPVEAVGWDGDMLEAQAFGFLAVRSIRGLHLSTPTTTGIRGPISGGILYQAK
ncbi:MAG: anhydro-N-acetylmuramic acid kinase [Pseudomonadota bacterium]|nr:anhydro-N-acetylmuramic acid kinase [Pseudomonadota bacterium]